MRKIRHCIVCGEETTGRKYCKKHALEAEKKYIERYRQKLKEMYGSQTGLWYQKNREKIREQYRKKSEARKKEKGFFNCSVCGKLVSYLEDGIRLTSKTCSQDSCKKTHRKMQIKKHYDAVKNTEEYKAMHRKWWYRYKEKMAEKGIIIKSRKKKND